MPRRQLHPHEGPPRRSGYYAVRGVAYDAEHLLGDLSAIAYLAHGFESATVRAGHRAIYWYMSLLEEDVKGGGAVAALVERFGATLDEQFRSITRATKPEDLRFDELFDRDPIAEWGTGPVTLLGDAAHPMLPHAGQGAAQALEDAVALGLALTSTDDVVGALRRYERVRSARTRKIVALARRIDDDEEHDRPMVARTRGEDGSGATAAVFVLPDRHARSASRAALMGSGVV